MANPTDDDDDLGNELDALRIRKSSDGPSSDSTVLAPSQSPPSQVPEGGQDTSPSETAEAETEPSVSLQKQQQEQDNDDCDDDGNNKKKKSENDTKSSNCSNYTILCDMAYGMPREARPRKEKIRAIARQLVNFLSWQQQQHSCLLLKNSCIAVENNNKEDSPLPLQQQPALVKIVGCADAAIEQSLKDRMLELWVQEVEQVQASAAATAAATGGNSATKPVINLPNNLTFTQQSLESFLLATTTRTDSNINDTTTRKDQHQQEEQNAIYLSPDASVALDPALEQPPPSMVVVGLLIDRTHVQVNRSLQRAQALSIPAARWPLEKIVLALEKNDDDKDDCNSNSSSTLKCDNDDKKKSAAAMATTTTSNTPRISLNASEPLNCDCILEGMQQWYWNYDKWLLNQTQSCRHNGDSDDAAAAADDDKKKAAAAAAAAREACFSDAVLQALQHHVQRHPGRPIHKT